MWNVSHRKLSPDAWLALPGTPRYFKPVMTLRDVVMLIILCLYSSQSHSTWRDILLCHITTHFLYILVFQWHQDEIKTMNYKPQVWKSTCRLPPTVSNSSNHSTSGMARTWLTWPSSSRWRESAPRITSPRLDPGSNTEDIWTTSLITCLLRKSFRYFLVGLI